jgi:trans-aconitate methyltransferase
LSAEKVSAGWLALREPADAAARALELVEELRRHLPRTSPMVIHDLGCGTGSMSRWLAPLLPGPQRWVLHDRDADLLETATAGPPGRATDGSAVTLETQRSDINELDHGELGDATLITASALLDMLTAEELSGLADLCTAAACPALLTLSVIGRVELTPADALDRRVAAAFNAHQRRTTQRGALLGPDAPELVSKQLTLRGAEVLVRSSPWRLGASDAELIVEWFRGWLWAACEQEPKLRAQTERYEHRRLEEASAGQLDVTVDHADLLVLPAASPRSPC